MSEVVFDHGIVKKIRNGTAFVAISENESCEHCGAKILCSPQGGKERGVYARNPHGACVGQHVEVSESEDLLLLLSVIQYGLPLLGFLLGIFVLYFSGVSLPGIAPEVIYFLGGLGGLGFASLLSWKWADNLARKSDFYFEISKIYNRESA